MLKTDSVHVVSLAQLEQLVEEGEATPETLALNNFTSGQVGQATSDWVPLKTTNLRYSLPALRATV